MNAPLSVTASGVFAALKTAVDSAGVVPPNSGAWRAVEVLAPQGTVVNATYPAPVVIEMSFPVRVEAYELRPDTGGAGRYRGGLGTRRTWRVLERGTRATVCCERTKSAPFGIAGGVASPMATKACTNPGSTRMRAASRCQPQEVVEPGSLMRKMELMSGTSGPNRPAAVEPGHEPGENGETGGSAIVRARPLRTGLAT